MDTEIEPSKTDDNGRGPGGRFASGNQAARGNPYAKRAAQLKAALFDAVTEDDIRAVVATLLTAARAGDIMACKIVLDRMFGKAIQPFDDVTETPPDENELDLSKLTFEQLDQLQAMKATLQN